MKEEIKIIEGNILSEPHITILSGSPLWNALYRNIEAQNQLNQLVIEFKEKIKTHE